jgi:hypothetical protein
MPAPAPPPWRSRALGYPSSYTPVANITRSCAHWTHMDSFTLLITPLYLSVPWLFPVFALFRIVFVMCSCPDAVPVPFHVRQLIDLHSLYLLLISCAAPVTICDRMRTALQEA